MLQLLIYYLWLSTNAYQFYSHFFQNYFLNTLIQKITEFYNGCYKLSLIINNISQWHLFYKKLLLLLLFTFFYQTSLQQIDLVISSRALMKKQNNHKTKKLSHRTSKIPLALRKNFIDAIVQDGMNIKEASKKFRLNYSSAKAIFQKYRVSKPRKHQIRQKGLEKYQQVSDKNNAQKQVQQKLQRCSYKPLQISQSNSQISGNLQKTYHKVNVFSTVGWDFMNQGVQKL